MAEDGLSREALRREIGKLTQRKMGATDRLRYRREANSVRRTVAELQAMVVELERMPDL